MWCRALLTTAIIAYLICVLLLSGMQKADLDVNTLKKLQRYNVNMDNLTYENTRQECLTKEKLYTTDDPKPIESFDKHKSVTIDPRETPISPTVIKYFAELQERRNVIAQNRSENILSSEPSVLEDIIRRRGKTDGDRIVEFNQKTHESNRTEIKATKRDTSQMNLEDALKALELFGRGTISSEISKANLKNHVDTPTTKNINFDNTGPKQDFEKNNRINYDNIKKISYFLSNILPKELTTSTTTTSTTTTEIINLDSISKQIDRYLILNTKSDNNMNYNKNFRRFTTPKNNEYSKEFTLTDKNNEKGLIDTKKNLKNNTIKYLNNLLGLDNSIHSVPSLQSITHYNSLQSPSISDDSVNLYPTTIIQNGATNNNVKTKTDDTKNVNQLITHDLIKDIAEKVKALVLNDLQKEITTTTTSISTSTTTEKIMNQTQIENTQEIAKAMQKLIELFQQQKSTKASLSITTISPSPTKPVADGINSHHAYSVPMKVIIPPIISLPNPYGIRNMPHEISPVLYNQAINTATPMPVPLLPLNSNTMNSIAQLNVFNDKNMQHISAVTMQTNLNEIPPLGIPVPKFLNPINQNIVLTTRNPFTSYKRNRGYKSRIKTDYKQSNNQENRENVFDFAKRLRPREEHGYYDYKDGYIEDFKRKFRERDSVLFNNRERNENIKSQNRDTSRPTQHSGYGNYHYESQPYKPNYRIARKEREHFPNENIKRFHERLERTDDWKRDSTDYVPNSDCCKIPERQQRPIKGGEYSKYDDTHFKNFLKTQQKVNDMLERILATKNVSDRPRSVELP